jgi:hypothetical protein
MRGCMRKSTRDYPGDGMGHVLAKLEFLNEKLKALIWNGNTCFIGIYTPNVVGQSHSLIEQHLSNGLLHPPRASSHVSAITHLWCRMESSLQEPRWRSTR